MGGMMMMMKWSLGNGLVLLVGEGEEETGRKEGVRAAREVGMETVQRKIGELIGKRR